MIDLLSVDIPALMQKHGLTFKAVEELNKFDTPTEIMWLCEAAQQATCILECGAHRGVSTKAMAMANPNAEIYVLDAWHDEGCREFFDTLLADEIAKGRVIPIQGLTNEGFALLERHHPNLKPDFAFIDASHEFPSVLRDIQNTLKLMSRGLISGHDFRHSIPTDGVNVSVAAAFGSDFSLPLDSIWAKRIP